MTAVTVELYQSRNHRKTHTRPQTWRWRATSANNRRIATSAEAYTNHADALDAITALFGPDSTVILKQADTLDVTLRIPEGST